jgi:TonB-dependent receptor
VTLTAVYASSHGPPLMNALRRFALLFALILAPALFAQGSATGTLTGRVTDAVTKLALSGARISVAGTSLRAFADQTGDFTIFNVPAGAQTLEFGYVGYGDAKQAVTVAAGAPTVANFAFGEETVKLGAFVIAGSAVGSARAINQQRAADTLTNMVSADAIGRFPDQNAAESMQRIPGVALYRDQGEGRFIVVRGIRPDLNTVQLNGIGVTSPDRGARTVPLDVIPSDALGGVEVAKVATPDKEMDGLGGRVDLKTRSAFDQKEGLLQFSAQGQYNALRDRYSSKYNGTYSGLFNDGKVGVIFSPTWQDRRMGSDNFEVSNPYTLRPVPGAPGQSAFFNNDINYREYDLTRKRYGANGALEFKPDAESYYYVRGLYSYFSDHENRYVTTIPFSEGTLTALTPVSATVTGVRRENKQLRIRTKTQDLYSISAGTELTRGSWQFDGHAAYSKGKEEKPEYTVIFRKSARGINWSYSFADGIYNPVVTQLAGTSISTPTLFDEFNRLRSAPSTGSESEVNIGGGARNNFSVAGDLPAYVKFGAQLRMKEKEQEREQVNFAAPASFNFPAMAQTQTSDDYGYFTGPRINAEYVTKTFIDNQSAFVGTRDLVSGVQDDYKTDEDVTALYGMGGVTLGHVNLIAGARYEHTQYETKGNQIKTTGATTTITPATVTKTYDRFLPGVYFNWNVDKKTVARAAWSNTLSRPSFAESSLRRSVSDDSRLVTENNPRLKPLTSMNFDASVEHYFSSLGVISAAFFYKDIKNFTYQRIVPGGDVATGYDLSTFVNGDTGHILGAEFNYSQQFRFLPQPFDGLGLSANYTATQSSARFPSRPGEKLPFIGQSKSIGNVALTYEKNGLFLRLALNSRSPRLREDEPLGTTAADDRYVDYFTQLDFTGSYRINRNWEVFAEVLNITNEPFRVHFSESSGRFLQFEEYDYSANFGVRWKL